MPAEHVALDLERIVDDLDRCEVGIAVKQVGDITQAINVLETSPQIGRSTVIDSRTALMRRRGACHYVPEIDTVFVLALRSRSGAGHLPEPV